MEIVGLILSGGKSSRFGSEKAVVKFGGVTFMERTARTFAPVAAQIALNAPTTSAAAALARAKGWPVLPDEPGDPNGPLAGIKAGLIWAKAVGADLLGVAPCDTPVLPPALFPRLMSEIGKAEAAAARTTEGVHPLCGVWRIEALWAVSSALAAGAHPAVQDLLTQIGARFVDFDDPRAFANVNTPEELAALGLVPGGRSE